MRQEETRSHEGQDGGQLAYSAPPLEVRSDEKKCTRQQHPKKDSIPLKCQDRVRFSVPRLNQQVTPLRLCLRTLGRHCPPKTLGDLLNPRPDTALPPGGRQLDGLCTSSGSSDLLDPDEVGVRSRDHQSDEGHHA